MIQFEELALNIILSRLRSQRRVHREEHRLGGVVWLDPVWQGAISNTTAPIPFANQKPGRWWCARSIGD